MTADNFIKTIAPHAVRDMHKTKVLASLTMAQAILESNWGRSGLTTNSNNLFGMKDFSGKGRNYKTKEFYDGKWVTVDAPFKEYDSWYDSIADHSGLFLRAPRYKAVLGETDYRKACIAVQKAGYATDPKYADLLISIIEKRSLQNFDQMTAEQADHWSGKTKPKRRKGEAPMELTEKQWSQLLTELQNLKKKDLVANDEWIEKAESKKLTASEAAFLSLILISRNS